MLPPESALSAVTAVCVVATVSSCASRVGISSADADARRTQCEHTRLGRLEPLTTRRAREQKRVQIEAWWSEAKAKYEPVAAPLEVEGQGEAVKVLAEVTGNFPGSPVKLTFAFRLAGARIEHLEITQ